MTPARLLLLIYAWASDPGKNATQIKASLALIKASVMNNPDSPQRGHDVAYYCDRTTAAITALETTSPPHSSDEIKRLLYGLCVTFMKDQ